MLYYDSPTPEVPRFYLNISKDYTDRFVFDGQLDYSSKFSSVGSQIIICDYVLTEKICMIGITKDLNIDILVYTPSRRNDGQVQRQNL